METKDKKQTSAEKLVKEPSAFAVDFFNEVLTNMSEGRQRQQDMRKRFEERRKKLGYTSTR